MSPACTVVAIRAERDEICFAVLNGTGAIPPI